MKLYLLANAKGTMLMCIRELNHIYDELDTF